VAHKNIVGKQQYIFTDDSEDRSDELVISSHGGYWSYLTGSITVPEWTTLHLFGPHGAALADPGVNNVAYGLGIYESIPPGGRVRNYSLSKYQGRHGNPDEDYDAIMRGIDSNREMVQMFLGADAAAQAKYSAMGTKFENFDVLTVRYRKFRFAPSLKNVLEILGRTDKWKYPHIHCVFCRSPIVGRSKTHDAKSNKRT